MAAARSRTTRGATLGTLAERWDGSAWTVERTADPPGSAYAILRAVSCTTATLCMAVGNAHASDRDSPLAEMWDGSSWTIVDLPAPPQATSALLSAVSCTSPAACSAVGAYSLDGGDPNLPLAEAWDGARWTLQSIPCPKGMRLLVPKGLACISPAACVSVGTMSTSRNPGGTTRPLALRYR